MGQKDSVTNDYLKQNHVFADAFNFFIYGGRPVIDPASLQELDTRGMAVPRDSVKGKDKSILRYRDSIKSLRAKYDDNGAYVILAVESQSHIHYAMPARTIMYDAIQYTKQVKEITAKHKLEGRPKGISEDEFLSGFTKAINCCRLSHWSSTLRIRNGMDRCHSMTCLKERMNI
jgi:hypothetical protein